MLTATRKTKLLLIDLLSLDAQMSLVASIRSRMILTEQELILLTDFQRIMEHIEERLAKGKQVLLEGQ